MENQPQINYRKRSFFSTLTLALGAVVVTCTLSGAVIILYGMNIADRKADSLVGFVEHGIRSLPELRAALPPVLADVLSDARRPEYRDQLEITGRLASARGPRGEYQPLVVVHNRGREVVSLLALRVTLLDGGVPVRALTEWCATPIAAEDWQGPLLPGSRRFVTPRPVLLTREEIADPDLDVEIVDLRVWQPAARRGGAL